MTKDILKNVHNIDLCRPICSLSYQYLQKASNLVLEKSKRVTPNCNVALMDHVFGIIIEWLKCVTRSRYFTNKKEMQLIDLRL